MNDHPPSITETAFNCPHCGAYAQQEWHKLRAARMAGPLPRIFTADAPLFQQISKIGDPTESLLMLQAKDALIAGHLVLGKNAQSTRSTEVLNGSLSICARCNKGSLWVHDHLYYPPSNRAPEANPDLPDSIRADYDEAGTILDLSPRGAAALLRLAVQKLCKELGHPGKNINDDIKSMVAEGLGERVQKALDTVRVIGNHAVHPGQIDLADDTKTAIALFKLVNLIAEKMISEPRHVDELYSDLPPEERDKIAKRDGTGRKPS